jgi:hypothetical protein
VAIRVWSQALFRESFKERFPLRRHPIVWYFGLATFGAQPRALALRLRVCTRKSEPSSCANPLRRGSFPAMAFQLDDFVASKHVVVGIRNTPL